MLDRFRGTYIQILLRYQRFNIMRCSFTQIEDGIYQCSTCGFKIKADCKPNEINRDCKKPLPPIFQQVKNLGTAVVKHVADGMKRVSDKEFEDRLSVCNECPLHQAGRCLECGCFISIKAKWNSEDCPKGKWDKLE